MYVPRRGIVVLDKDGTMRNSEPGYEDEFAGILEARYDIPREEARIFFRETCGMPTSERFSIILARYGKPLDDLGRLCSTYAERGYREIAPLFPDVIPCLEELKRRDYRLIVSSNMPQQELDRRIAASDLDCYFEGWLGTSPSVPHKRGHKEYIRRRFRISEEHFRQHSSLIGDSPLDMDIAREWGSKGVFIRRPHYQGNATADVILASLTELPGVLDRIFSQ